jgi:hypothetical protein
VPAPLLRFGEETRAEARVATFSKVDVSAIPRQDLPELLGEVAALEARIRLRLAEAPSPVPRSDARLVPLTEAWARAHGYRLETAAKLARAGRLAGARPAPTGGKGRRRRWLVPAELVSEPAV